MWENSTQLSWEKVLQRLLWVRTVQPFERTVLLLQLCGIDLPYLGLKQMLPVKLFSVNNLFFFFEIGGHFIWLLRQFTVPLLPFSSDWLWGALVVLGIQKFLQFGGAGFSPGLEDP